MARANRPSIRRRLARRGPDVAVSEAISYIFMLALGAVALTVSLGIMDETRSDSAEIGAGIQLKQVGELTAVSLEEVVRTASALPNSSYEVNVTIPRTIADHTYTVEGPADECGGNSENHLTIRTDDGLIETNVSLGGADDVLVEGIDLFDECLSFHSSAGSITIVYDPTPSPDIQIRKD